MKSRIYLLTALVSALALTAVSPAQANEKTTFDHVKTGFTQAVNSISGWFGDDNAPLNDIAPAAGEVVEAIPTYNDPSQIEPAAGYDADALQVPPAYIAPVSNNVSPRATAFDNDQSIAAFGADEPTAQDLANIATAAGDETQETTVCEIEADESITGDAETVSTACEHKNTKAAEPEKSPAQPAFEPVPATGELPETRPAAGSEVVTDEVVEETTDDVDVEAPAVEPTEEPVAE